MYAKKANRAASSQQAGAEGEAHRNGTSNESEIFEDKSVDEVCEFLKFWGALQRRAEARADVILQDRQQYSKRAVRRGKAKPSVGGEKAK